MFFEINWEIKLGTFKIVLKKTFNNIKARI